MDSLLVERNGIRMLGKVLNGVLLFICIDDVKRFKLV
jgi:hypothetical protein